MIAHIYPSMLQAVSGRGYAGCLDGCFQGWRGGDMQHPGYELPRIHIPRTWVNKGKKKGPGSQGTRPETNLALPSHRSTDRRHAPVGPVRVENLFRLRAQQRTHVLHGLPNGNALSYWSGILRHRSVVAHRFLLSLCLVAGRECVFRVAGPSLEGGQVAVLRLHAASTGHVTAAAYSWERGERITQLQYFYNFLGELRRTPCLRTSQNSPSS